MMRTHNLVVTVIQTERDLEFCSLKHQGNISVQRQRDVRSKSEDEKSPYFMRVDLGPLGWATMMVHTQTHTERVQQE